MIVHSTANTLDDDCVVQVEGIEPGTPESTVRLFAHGAAAKHNTGYQVQTSHRLVWLDDQGRALGAHLDTTDSTSARVLCRVVAP
jgi:hypothetical protein